jgi:hypothetical protein
VIFAGFRVFFIALRIKLLAAFTSLSTQEEIDRLA